MKKFLAIVLSVLFFATPIMAGMVPFDDLTGPGRKVIAEFRDLQFYRWQLVYDENTGKPIGARYCLRVGSSQEWDELMKFFMMYGVNIGHNYVDESGNRFCVLMMQYGPFIVQRRITPEMYDDYTPLTADELGLTSIPNSLTTIVPLPGMATFEAELKVMLKVFSDYVWKEYYDGQKGI